jgi:O-antigen/teichoic acid export membrane protein
VSEKNSEKKIMSGLFWTFGERICAQLVTTVVSIILARVLDPEHYGIISIVMVFISICNVFVTSGFGSAVIQSKTAEEKDFDTAFWMSFGLAILLYGVLFISAPFISAFYNMEQLTSVMRVMGLRIPIASVNSIQQAYVRRQMVFKRFFIATLFGTVISGVVGVVLAMSGFGVWALVAQYLTNTTVDTIILWFVGGWQPKIRFSKKKVHGIFSFGWKTLATDLIVTLEGDIRSLIIGKVFSSADLAYYDQGKKIPSLLVTNINASINKVMLPAYSRSQDNLGELKRMLRRSIQIGIFILAPILLGLAAVSEQFVKVILTEKWIPCIPLIQIFCVSYLTRPLETACHQALLAIGKSDVVLKIIMCINVVDAGALLIAAFVFKSVQLIAVGSIAVMITSLVCFMFNINKYLGYKLREQLKDIVPSIVCALIMVIVVIFAGKIKAPQILVLCIQILIGGIVYVATALMIKVEPFMYLFQKIRKY